jgi:hypothetical protein
MCCVFFAVGTKFLNIILKSFSFKGLTTTYEEVDHTLSLDGAAQGFGNRIKCRLSTSEMDQREMLHK